MKAPILLFCSLLCVQTTFGDRLSDADRESLLESLERLQNASQANSDGKLKVAISAFGAAMSSDQATLELYLNCLEKVNFVDRDKSGVDFAKWKRTEGDKLSEPGLKLALRHQLRWLILTLQASNENADRVKLVEEARESVDAIFREPERLRGQDAILGQSVTSSVFATAYGIDGVKVESWPMSPVQLDTIYEDLLLPRWRSSKHVAELRSTWVKRILQERAKVEFFPARDTKKKDQRAEQRAEAIEENIERQKEKFASETQPQLEWDMEMDLFKHGDEKGAAVRMFAHLQQHVLHAAAKEWAEELGGLLTPEAPATPPKTEKESL